MENGTELMIAWAMQDKAHTILLNGWTNIIKLQESWNKTQATIQHSMKDFQDVLVECTQNYSPSIYKQNCQLHEGGKARMYKSRLNFIAILQTSLDLRMFQSSLFGVCHFKFTFSNVTPLSRIHEGECHTPATTFKSKFTN